jgi:hypothetical protein
MAFTVTYQANFPDDTKLDNDVYEFLEGGVLAVTTRSSAKTVYYAPGVWKTVTADQDHRPAQQKGGG